MTQFKPEEMIERRNKDGSITKYPIVGGRLRLLHEVNEKISITTNLIQFTHLQQATVQAKVTTAKGEFSAYGCSSVEKDKRLVTSLLELAETRACARALRFAGYGVEFTGSEEIEDDHGFNQVPKAKGKVIPFGSISDSHKHAIETMCMIKKWNPIEVCRRILSNRQISDLNELSSEEAIQVIEAIKEKISA